MFVCLSSPQLAEDCCVPAYFPSPFDETSAKAVFSKLESSFPTSRDKRRDRESMEIQCVVMNMDSRFRGNDDIAISSQQSPAKGKAFG